MQADILLGLQWGDEGKGKIVDVLTPRYDIIARFQGGPNAGHTLEFEGIKHVLHTIPSGIFRDGIINLVGNGVVIDPIIFKTEIDALVKMNVPVRERLLISKKAHLILPTHRILDAASEASKGKGKIGSTLKGIGPTYMDKTGRNGLRVGDILSSDFKERYDRLVAKHKTLLSMYDFEYDLVEQEKDWLASIEFLKKFQIIDSEYYVNNAMKAGKAVLAEGAQGSLLDIDFGSYPFVTSSTTTAAGASTGLGIAPNKIGKVYGIFKAYCTRVGSGPFPTELFDEDGQKLRDIGHEYGATTGRERRCGWIDLPALKYAIMINGVTHLNMMKGDVMDTFEKIKICTSYKTKDGLTDILPFEANDNDLEPVYIEMKGWQTDLTKMSNAEELPPEMNDYIAYLEKELETPISIVSVGPDRSQTIMRDSVLA